MKSKKSILLITSRLPYPPIGGDRLKNYWLLNILSKHYRIHLVSITENQVPDQFYKWVMEIGITYKIFPKRKIEFYKSAFHFLFNKLPIQVNYYYFRDVQRYINRICKNYDLIFSTLMRTARYVMDKKKPKILDMADSIGLNYKKAKMKTTSIKWKFIHWIESKRVLNYEKFCISNFDKTLFFNKKEMEYFNNPDKTEWMPHGVNEELFTYDKVDEKYKNWVVFFGKMDYQPNQDAVIWFFENVLPCLNENIIFGIVGAYPTNQILRMKKKYKNVEITGFVNDPYVILKSSLCMVVPMHTGGGIQNKVLEAMALGTINIITSLAAEAIAGAQNGKEFLIIDEPIRIAQTINDIYVNSNKYEYLKANSKEFIKNNFTWSIYESKILAITAEMLK